MRAAPELRDPELRDLGGAGPPAPSPLPNEAALAALAGIELRFAPGTALEQVGDQLFLFSEEGQQLHALNASGAILAARLGDRTTIEALIGELLRLGLGRQAAAAWAEAFLRDMAARGVLAARPRRRSRPVVHPIEVAGQRLALHYFSADLARLMGRSFEHLAAAGGGGEAAIELFDAGAFVLIGGGDGQALVVEREQLAVRLKGAILSRILGSSAHLAALHAACVVRDGCALLLLGSPGSGKTMLTLALLEKGYAYGSDDVTLLQPGGQVAGVALAPGVKESGWATAQTFGRLLEDLPVHVRPDGQKVRFVNPVRTAAQAVPAAAIVTLTRTDGPRSLAPLAPAAAFSALLAESLSQSGKCSVETMRSLAGLVRGARCFELRYREAGEAAELLHDPVGHG